jgi:uncharacterized protein YcbX
VSQIEGVVSSLRRHPVKSMLGETAPALLLDADGVIGDRAFAVLDEETGLIASAKNPRKWRGLLTISARSGGRWTHAGAPPPVYLTLPDGRVYEVGDPLVHKEIGAVVGREVRVVSTPPPGAAMERSGPVEVLDHGIDADVPVLVNEVGGAPAGRFLDYGPVHLLTTATLARIGRLAHAGRAMPAVRYRPNVVLDLGEHVTGFAENDWPGLRVRIGPEVVLKVLLPTPRCAVPTLAHGELPPDMSALAVVAAANRVEAVWGQACAGCYASVESPGRIAVGDPVSIA